jgi:hypothetical protein
MPFVKLLHIDKYSVMGVWKISEKVERLLQEYGKIPNPPVMPSFQSEGRQQEWLATRLLLNKLGYSNRIEYDRNGKTLY